MTSDLDDDIQALRQRLEEQEREERAAQAEYLRSQSRECSEALGDARAERKTIKMRLKALIPERDRWSSDG